MALLKGIDIILHEKVQTGTDDFGMPTYRETPVTVSNVLVAPASDDDVISSQTLYGKHAVYTLGIPKGDTHKWEDSRIEFFGQNFHSFGATSIGIEELIPLEWNRKVKVELYEQGQV